MTDPTLLDVSPSSKWIRYFMAEAELASTMATCPRAHCGAAAVRLSDKRVLVKGHNGTPPGFPHCSEVGCIMEMGADNREHCVAVVHAERNVFYYAAKRGISLDGSHLFVTHYPCLDCAKGIITSGMRGVFYRDEYKPDPKVADYLARAEIYIRQVA